MDFGGRQPAGPDRRRIQLRRQPGGGGDVQGGAEHFAEGAVLAAERGREVLRGILHHHLALVHAPPPAHDRRASGQGRGDQAAAAGSRANLARGEEGERESGRQHHLVLMLLIFLHCRLLRHALSLSSCN